MNEDTDPLKIVIAIAKERAIAKYDRQRPKEVAAHHLPSLIVVLFMLQPTINPMPIIVSNCNCMKTISLYDALIRMREFTQMSVPFSFEYITCNLSKNSSNGLKQVSKGLLRTGLSRDISEKSDILIGYTEEPSQNPKWFYLPLLTKFNGIPIKP